MKPIRTGEILPLDYGIVDHVNGESVLWTPTSVARGRFMIATQGERREMIRQSALVTGIHPKELGELVRHGVQKKHNGQDTLLSQIPKYSVTKVRAYHDGVTAQVASQSGGSPVLVSFQINASEDGPRLWRPAATTDSAVIGELKGAIGRSYVSPHIAALAAVIEHDNELPTSQTISRLLPRNRSAQVPQIPFKKLRAPLNTGDVIAQYYGIGDNQYHTSIDFFRRNGIEYDLRNRIHQGRAHFGIIAHKPATREVHTLTSTEQEIYASIGVTLAALEQYATKDGFHASRGRNFARELVATPYETIARRFERNGEVLHILGGMRRTRPDGVLDIVPPMLVHRNLENSIRESSGLAADFSPFAHVAAGTSYMSVDDMTRRVGLTTIYTPSTSTNLQIPTSRVLERLYERWLTQN